MQRVVLRIKEIDRAAWKIDLDSSSRWLLVPVWIAIGLLCSLISAMLMSALHADTLSGIPAALSNCVPLGLALWAGGAVIAPPALGRSDQWSIGLIFQLAVFLVWVFSVHVAPVAGLAVAMTTALTAVIIVVAQRVAWPHLLGAPTSLAYVIAVPVIIGGAQWWGMEHLPVSTAMGQVLWTGLQFGIMAVGIVLLAQQRAVVRTT